jgi:hypothetical protein
VSIFVFLDAGVGFYLALRVNSSYFWHVGQSEFSFDTGRWVYVNLIIISVFSILLLISAIGLIAYPEAPFRWFGTIISLVGSLGMIYLGARSMLQTLDVRSHIELYCHGGFVDMTDIVESYTVRLHEVERQYVGEYMCITDRCECSNKIEPASFGIRISEFDSLSYSEGEVDTFYEDCYLPLVETGVLKALPEEFLDLLKNFEEKYDCSGICEPPLFYFFKTNQYGAPPRSCMNEIIDFYWYEAGAIGAFGFGHGVALFVYFIV